MGLSKKIIVIVYEGNCFSEQLNYSVEFSFKVGNHQVGDLLLKGRVGVLADSESV
jgi:hypothetical protein